MKRVLIICDLFPPAFGPRMGYLCKYIRAEGWEPMVLTEQVTDEHAFGFLEGSCEVTYVNYYSTSGKWQHKPEWLRKLEWPHKLEWFRKLKWPHKFEWFLVFLLDICFGYKNQRMYKEAERLLRQRQVDVILCSTYRTFPLPAARKAARTFNLPLVVDLRDIIEQYTGMEFIAHTMPSFLGIDKLAATLFKRESLATRNKVVKAARCVTTISPWHVEVLKMYNPVVKLIYNGFDPELFYPERIITRQFIITYTGRLLSTAMRDPSLLFEAVARLSAGGILHPAACQIHWYVDPGSWNVIAKEAEKYGIAAFMTYKGYVAASEIPGILNHSSLLLLLTNRSNGAGPKGVMTTKFFESLAVGKPVLCVRSDESYLAEAIRHTNAGLAATNVDEVCDFLRFYHQEWNTKGYTASSVDKDKLQVYSRREQARQFASIFNEMTRNG